MGQVSSLPDYPRTTFRTPVGSGARGKRRACVLARAGAARLFPDRPALAPTPYLPSRLQMHRKDAIGPTCCPSDQTQFFSLQLAAREKASPSSSAYSLETWRHRGSRYWRTPGTATAHFRRRRRLCPLGHSQPPPPFHHGRLCVVWGEAGPPIALRPHPHPLGAGFQGTAFPNPAGKVSHPPIQGQDSFPHLERQKLRVSPPFRIRSQRVPSPLLQGWQPCPPLCRAQDPSLPYFCAKALPQHGYTRGSI